MALVIRQQAVEQPVHLEIVGLEEAQVDAALVVLVQVVRDGEENCIVLSWVYLVEHRGEFGVFGVRGEQPRSPVFGDENPFGQLEALEDEQ